MKLLKKVKKKIKVNKTIENSGLVMITKIKERFIMATWIEGKAFVPEITEEKLNNLIQKIVPVVRENNKLYLIEIPDLRSIAYT